MMVLFSKLVKTFRYAFSVQGYSTISESSFPARMGCRAEGTDKFTIPLTEAEYSGGVSLAEFHAAFLCSPIFSTELWILSKLGLVEPESLQSSHLMNVAMGDRSCLGPWTAWALDGNRIRPISSTPITTTTTNSATESEGATKKKDPVVPCQIMRARFHGKPFCDTWWAVELADDEQVSSSSSTAGERVRHPQLVFGTYMIHSSQDDDDSSTTGVARSILFKVVLDPLHRLYSRILLASAKATLVANGQKRSK